VVLVLPEVVVERPQLLDHRDLGVGIEDRADVVARFAEARGFGEGLYRIGVLRADPVERALALNVLQPQVRVCCHGAGSGAAGEQPGGQAQSGDRTHFGLPWKEAAS
jgi:hypothetical protein